MMSQMNNGKSGLTIDEQLKELERVLDEYDKKFLLNKILVNPEVDTILGLKQEEIKILPRELCFTYSFMLCSFGGAVQKEHNRQMAKLKWAEHNLNIIVAKEQENYGNQYTKYEVRKAMIVADNEYAKALNKVILDSTCQIEELNYLSKTITTLGDILKEYGKSKRNDNA
jgi:hypothetical protein